MRTDQTDWKLKFTPNCNLLCTSYSNCQSRTYYHYQTGSNYCQTYRYLHPFLDNKVSVLVIRNYFCNLSHARKIIINNAVIIFIIHAVISIVSQTLFCYFSRKCYCLQIRVFLFSVKHYYCQLNRF